MIRPMPCVSDVAAMFSIKGMVTLFSGAPVLIIAMATMMEAGKLVTAGWLARRWRATAWVWRLVLMVLVAGLAVINAAGVYAQLVAAHVGDRGAATSAIEAQDATLAARIEVAAHVVDDLDRRLGQIDTAIETAAKRGKTSTALSAIDGQKKARAGLSGERNEAAGTLATLKAECIPGCPRPQDRDGSRTDQVRRRAYRRRHRLRAGDSLAHCLDGVVLRSSRHCPDGRGLGAAVTGHKRYSRPQRVRSLFGPHRSGII
jgi:hypothetical protein